MADMSAFAGTAFELVAPLVGKALRSFFATTLGMAVLTLLVSVAAFFLAGGLETPWLRTALAVLVALVAGAVLAVLLASKRAISFALAEGLSKFRLAERLVRTLFAKLGVNEASQHGDRGGHVVRRVERLPLAEAERRLHGCVHAMLGERAASGGSPVAATGFQRGGFFATRIRAAAIRQVQRLTLARFREAQAREGGVDLALVRDELAERGDELLRDAVLDKAKKLTLLVAAAYVAGTLLVAYGLRFVPFAP